MPGEAQHDSKTKLLDAALQVIRAKGYAATTIDDICHQAGVTKGSFFHHFKSKDYLALSAVEHWGTMTEGLFANAPYHAAKDPLARVLGYIDFREAILTGELTDYTCLLGTLVQETYDTHPNIRAACDRGMSAHIAELARDIEAAKKRYAARASWSPQSAGYFIQTVLQGSFIFAKAKQSPEIVRENLAHLRRYLAALFTQPSNTKAQGELTMTAKSSVHLHRVLAAHPENVYRAFIEPDAMARWLPPNGFTAKVHHMDARVGGSYKMSFTNFTTGSSQSFGGEYREIGAQ